MMLAGGEAVEMVVAVETGDVGDNAAVLASSLIFCFASVEFGAPPASLDNVPPMTDSLIPLLLHFPPLLQAELLTRLDEGEGCGAAAVVSATAAVGAELQAPILFWQFAFSSKLRFRFAFL